MQPISTGLSRRLDDYVSPTLENLLALVILCLAIFSRFDQLGARAMSHDEINHVVPAYDFSQGGDYHYDPMTHGPLQFHLLALSYFLLGDSDFTSRLPAACFSVLTVGIALFAFRRYLGRVGALSAGVLLLISPYMLFYGRYARNEAFIVVWGLLILYAILWYLETGRRGALVLFTLANALHFTDKATAYIFAAEQLVFLALYFLYQVGRRTGCDPRRYQPFWMALGAGLFLLVGAGGVYVLGGDHWLGFSLALAGMAFAAGAVALLGRRLGWAAIRQERSFDLLLLLAGLVLPLLSAGLVKGLGFDPLDYSAAGLLPSGVVFVMLALLSLALGLWWKGREWPVYAVLFYGPFVLFYSTLLTYLPGLVGGVFGALGYWMQQQAIQRGEQPLYYYALIQIPLYEFLPLLGTLAALMIGWRRRLWQTTPGPALAPPAGAETESRPAPVLALFLFWSFSNLAAFTLAGEKMPWLTVHIALPMILATAWAVQYLLETWPTLGRPHPRLRAIALGVMALLAILTARAAYRAAFLLYDDPLEYLVYAHSAPDPKRLLAEVEQISRQTTGGLDLVVAYDNQVRYPYWWYLRHYPNRIDYDAYPSYDLRRAAIIFVGEENYGKVEPIVRQDYLEYSYTRLWWPNPDYWALKWTSIDAGRRAAAGSESLPPMTLAEYLRLSWQRLAPFWLDSSHRHALWQIWLNRNYEPYAQLVNCSTCTLSDWQPSNRMRMYLRKDVAARVWCGGECTTAAIAVDPYAAQRVELQPDRVVGGLGGEAGQFQSPRGVAVAPDGSLYVADSRNHRIQHLTQQGAVLQVWGAFADVAQGAAPGGMFNEPWGVAVAPDGSVYVTDTWNHRVQKFSADGRFQLMWGTLGQGERPDAFYGPRGIAVDERGNVFVADTGNKRIVVFDARGNYLTQFGGAGAASGQLDEPVGLAVDAGGNVYVADTWNRRVQVFSPRAAGGYAAQAAWAVDGWFGSSLENKPFLALDARGDVLVTDPESCQVLQFSTGGRIERVWGHCDPAAAGSGGFSGIAVDGQDGVWLSDAANHRLLHYSLGAP